ncbi:hypothetical protein [Abyssisolibacter fermentans]|nr:hypothetical protein [Abyssisolibacter fermentans]
MKEKEKENPIKKEELIKKIDEEFSEKTKVNNQEEQICHHGC